MWGMALRVIPRLTKEEWNKLDIVSRWFIATRSAVLIMTFLSAAIGGLAALYDGKFNACLWTVCAFGLVMAHATNNLLNDLVDQFRGVDSGNYFRAQYGPQVLEHGFMTPAKLLLYIVFTGTLACLCGAYLIWARGSFALWLFLAGSFFLVFYTYPLKYLGLGEPAVLAVWGPLMTGGSYFIASGEWSWGACLLGLTYALGVTTVLFGKHIDKLDDDKKRKIGTLPVRIGEKAARLTVIVLTILQYIAVVYLAVFLGRYLLLLALFSAGLFIQTVKVYSAPRPAEPPKDYPEGTWPLYFVAYAFLHNRRFGLLFLLGLVLDLLAKNVLKFY
jgi:1,4-dihydroxy-2-naphthoate octaprenyltransferase